MLTRWITRRDLSRAGFWGAGIAAALLSGPSAWSQQVGSAADRPPPGESRATQDRNAPDADQRPTAARPSEADQRATREWLEEQARIPRRPSSRHPAHEQQIEEVRAEVELLEAQVEAKKAHIRLVEARLKQAKGRQELLRKQSGQGSVPDEKKIEIEGEVGVLEAEVETERAEIKEPQVLLRHARRHLAVLEASDGGPAPTAGMPAWGGDQQLLSGYMGMHPVGLYHAGMHPMEMHPMEMHHMAMSRIMDVDDRLFQLRDAIEGLEYEVERLGSRLRR
jgi:hypothetical protein